MMRAVFTGTVWMCVLCGIACGQMDAADAVSGATPVYDAPTVRLVNFRDVCRLYEDWNGKPAVIVDARFEYDGHKLPAAVFLNTKSPEEEVRRLLPDKKQRIVVYCSNCSCPASYWMAQRLLELGYEQVREYPGGIDEWIRLGGKVEPATKGLSQCESAGCGKP